MAVSGSLLAKAENETFPDLGRTYDVFFAENARRVNGQIKVIRKGEGSWIFVEYTTRYLSIGPAPGTRPPAPEDFKTTTKKLWINTQWIVSASEPKTENK